MPHHHFVFWGAWGSEERRAYLKTFEKEFEGKVIVDISNIFYVLPESEHGRGPRSYVPLPSCPDSPIR